MNQDTSNRKSHLGLKFILILFALLCLGVGLYFVLKNNSFAPKSKNENGNSSSVVTYSDISPSPELISQVYSETTDNKPLDELNEPRYCSYNVTVNNTASETKYGVVVCGDKFKISGENKTVICDSFKTQIKTSLYNSVFDNDKFDMFTELGTVSLDYVKSIVKDFPDNTSVESNDGIYLVTYTHDRYTEQYEVQKSTGLVISGKTYRDNEIITSFIINDIASVDPDAIEDYFKIIN